MHYRAALPPYSVCVARKRRLVGVSLTILGSAHPRVLLLNSQDKRKKYYRMAVFFSLARGPGFPPQRIRRRSFALLPRTELSIPRMLSDAPFFRHFY